VVIMTTDTIPRPTSLTYDDVSRMIAKRSFATLATASPQHHPHVAGVLYADVDGVLYVSTMRSSRKARNVAANPDVFVCIPVRRIPFGAPPSSVQFAATAELLAVDHPDVVALAAAGRLKAITGHGELELPDGCVVRITPSHAIHTYGLGMPLRTLAKDPLNAAGRVVKPV
jgi:Pyridoxamine 5'-phosphate oxidase